MKSRYWLCAGLLSMSAASALAADRCEQAFQKTMDRQVFPDRTAALRHFEGERAACGKEALYLSRLASLLKEVGRAKEAEATIAAGLSLHPRNRELLFGKGTIDLEHENAASARSIAKGLIQSHPDWLGGHYLMQRALMDSRKFQESIPHGLRAIELSGGTMTVLYLNVGVASYHAGRFEDCVKYVRMAIEKDPAVLSKPWGINEAIYALDRLERRAEALSLAKQRKEADANWQSDPVLVRMLKVMGVVQ